MDPVLATRNHLCHTHPSMDPSGPLFSGYHLNRDIQASIRHGGELHHYQHIVKPHPWHVPNLRAATCSFRNSNFLVTDAKKNNSIASKIGCKKNPFPLMDAKKNSISIKGGTGSPGYLKRKFASTYTQESMYPSGFAGRDNIIAINIL